MTNPLLPQDEKNHIPAAPGGANITPPASAEEIRLNAGQAAALARCLALSDDEQVQALLCLVCGLAYEPEMTQRDNLAHAVMIEIYRYTADATHYADKFIREGWRAVAPITTPTSPLTKGEPT